MYASARIVNASAEDLAFIPNDSMDYVLTDPPYADIVRYYERSFVRNAWLGFKIGASQVEYPAMMQKVLREVNRVLRPGKHLSVLLKGTSQEFRDEFVGLAENAGLTHESTDQEHLGYGNKQDRPADHVLNFMSSV